MLSGKDGRRADGSIENGIGLGVVAIGRAADNVGRDIVTRKGLEDNVEVVVCIERGFTRRLEH